MERRSQTWLGWPVGLVIVLLIVSAVTGTAGPVEVIWLLGSVSVAVSMVGIYFSGRSRSGRAGHGGADTHPSEDHPAEPPTGNPDPQPGHAQPPTGNGAGTGSGASPG